MALAAFAVFCKIHYSDGDDALFDYYVNSTPFLEYIKERFLTWTGRLGGETAVYVSFSLGIWFWRVVNALMVTALPTLLFLIVRKIYPKECDPLASWPALRLFATGAFAFLLMDIVTCGHAAVWVNGSIFYTWTLASALLCIYLTLDTFTSGTVSRPKLIASIPFGIFAVSSIEQIGFVVLAYFACGIAISKYRKNSVPATVYAESAALLAIFAVSVAAPGNSARVATETQTWFPAFATLSPVEHAFICIQWLLSSLANEAKAFFVIIWIACLMAAPARNRAFTALTAIFTIAALLPFAGITILSDTGINYIDPAVRPEVFPCIANAGAWNFVAMAWWLAATVFTFLTVHRSLGIAGTATLSTGMLCEAMMFFSPTIYASGERVFFMTDWLLMFLFLAVYLKVNSERQKNALFTIVVILGLVNLVSQASELLAKLNGG